jgi:hypothetical protein
MNKLDKGENLVAAVPPPNARAMVVGYGPAGLGVFAGALQLGCFAELLDLGVFAIDSGDLNVIGRIGRYAINSDSHAESFLAVVGPLNRPLLPQLLASPAAQDLLAARGGPVPLALVAQFQAELARALHGAAARLGHRLAYPGWRARHAQRVRQGWVVQLEACDKRTDVHVDHLVLATGARQRVNDLGAVRVGNTIPMVDRPEHTVGSDTVLGHGGPRVISDLLARCNAAKPRRAVVVGASHSALASALVLLRLPGDTWGEGSITVLHRHPMRPMYPSPQQARAEGFTDFGSDDICPRTGRVLPLAGFRAESRELLASIRGFGGRDLERRVHLVPLGDTEPAEVDRLLGEADVIVLATGYRPLGLDLIGVNGRRLALAGVHGPGPMVDGHSRVLDAAGDVVPGVYALGLASGYPLAGRHGEPSFRGQANGLSLWQTDIGAEVARALTVGTAEAAVRRA